jgi:amidase
VTDLVALDATAQAALVRAGDASPLELVDAAIARVEALNPALNAVIHERFERARAEAEQAASLDDAPFRGVPLLVKDHDGPLAGEPYHHGNRLLKELGHRADHDAHLIRLLRRAGFVVIGKTNVPEFGLLPTTEPTAYGATVNPWDRMRSAGGSSGGSAAAVAAGMTPVAHAGDGGGSIRIPASMCGLPGLKPTRGRVSLGPDEGEAWSGLVVRHVLTRSVRDSAAVLDAVAGAQPGDPYAAPPPSRAFLDDVGAPGPRLRVGARVRAPGDLAVVAPDCVAAVEDAASVLASLGHVVEWDESPHALDDLDALLGFTVVQSSAVAADVAWLGRVAGREICADDVETLTWALHEQGRALGAPEHVTALEGLRAWSRRVASWWEPGDAGEHGFDLLLTPTLCEPPPHLGEIAGDAPDPEPALARIVPFGVFTAPFNITGQPAVSVPSGRHGGLPIGVQLVAATGREDLLFRTAAELEQARPWAQPPAAA